MRLEIFNIQGQRIRTLIRRSAAPGRHLKVWDGRDQSGAAVASGTYVYRLQVGEHSQVKKLLLLR